MIDKKIKEIKEKYNNTYEEKRIILKPGFGNVPTRPTNETVINKV